MEESGKHRLRSSSGRFIGVGMITVRINGQTREVAAGLSVEQLLGQLELPAVGTLVERNGAALFPREFGVTPVEADDRLELVRIAAGG